MHKALIYSHPNRTIIKEAEDDFTNIKNKLRMLYNYTPLRNALNNLAKTNLNEYQMAYNFMVVVVGITTMNLLSNRIIASGIQDLMDRIDVQNVEQLVRFARIRNPVLRQTVLRYLMALQQRRKK